MRRRRLARRRRSGGHELPSGGWGESQGESGRFPNTTLTYPNRREATVEQHRAIVRAIEARDQDQAGDLCAQHFSDARDIRLAQSEDEDRGRARAASAHPACKARARSGR
ncbi:FCD domain-containing protein [Spirillospora sp. CA-108201]